MIHQQVGQQHRGPRPSGRERSDVRPGQVGGVGRDGTGPERHLAQEGVARPDERVQVLRAAAVARVDQARARRRRRRGTRSSRPCVPPGGLDGERSDLAHPDRQWLDVQRRRAEARLRVQAVQALAEAGRTEDPDPARRGQVPAQVVAERDEVDEVVGMEMRDHDRQQVARAPLARPGAGTSPGRGPAARPVADGGPGTPPRSRPMRSVKAGPAPRTSSSNPARRPRRHRRRTSRGMADGPARPGRRSAARARPPRHRRSRRPARRRSGAIDGHPIRPSRARPPSSRKRATIAADG